MTDIFLSYRRTDAGKARSIAEALRAEGFDIGRDEEAGAEAGPRGGAGSNLEAAKAVLVLWSAKSITTKRVLMEVRFAQERAALVPILLGSARPPDRFAALPSTDLTGWRGDRTDPRWRSLVVRLKAMQGIGPARIPAISLFSLRRSWKRFLGALLALIAILSALQQFEIMDVSELVHPKVSGTQTRKWKAIRATRSCAALRTYLNDNPSGPFAREAQALLDARPPVVRWAPFEQSLPAPGTSPESADGSRAAACSAARAAAEATARENCGLFRTPTGDTRNLAVSLGQANCDCRSALGHWQCTFPATAQCRGEQRIKEPAEVCGG